MQRSSQERLQTLIFALEQGKGAAVLKLLSLLLGFALLAFLYNLNAYHGFAGQEAMESAHLARQLAEGKGYNTDSIRPFAVGLLQRANPAGASQVLNQPVPDLSVAPGYPFLLSLAMKVLPFRFGTDKNQPWTFQPELWIAGINEILLFGAVLLVFVVARRLFDSGVAWTAAILFTGTEMYWKFSVSGLSTILLLLIFLYLAWILLAVEERERRVVLPGAAGSVALGCVAGLLVAVGALTRYSIAWMIVPTLLFLSRYGQRVAGKACLGAVVVFAVVLGPWVGRNVVLSNAPFGTAGYAVLENTIPGLEQDRLERSLNPTGRIHAVAFNDVMAKFLANEAAILRNDLPRLGGNWISAFFLCGLLLPFRGLALQRVRHFLVGSLVLLAVVQGVGQTHLSVDAPEINTENLLVVLSPLVLIFGTGFFFTLLDQMALADPKARGGVISLVVLVLSGPLLLALGTNSAPATISPYSPFQIQRTAAMMKRDELMMSDIPWAVAWYGEQPCAWLTLDDAGAYADLNAIKPIQAIYLTQQTSDRPFLSQMVYSQRGWGNFLLNSLPETLWPQGEVPTGFPLRNAPLDYLPSQMFISDKIRWQEGPK